jgi:hypothetical protein
MPKECKNPIPRLKKTFFPNILLHYLHFKLKQHKNKPTLFFLKKYNTPRTTYKQTRIFQFAKKPILFETKKSRNKIPQKALPVIYTLLTNSIHLRRGTRNYKNVRLKEQIQKVICPLSWFMFCSYLWLFHNWMYVAFDRRSNIVLSWETSTHPFTLSILTLTYLFED